MHIDAHHHFWKYSAAEYGWMGEGMERIRRDFLPADLQNEIHKAGVDGVVSVQARQTVEETEFLLAFAREHAFIRSVVGWAPLIAPDVADTLDRWAGEPFLKGVRHVLHDEQDDDYMLREDFNRGVALLAGRNLVYDILIREKHLLQTLDFVDRHPNQVFIVDHIAKPLIADGQIEPWRSRMAELARRPNVYCKISGMATEADWQAWKPEQLTPYYDAVLAAFGPARLMFGSDWPVCLVAVEYDDWHRRVEGWVSALSDDERSRILGGTALEAYKLA